MVQGGGIIIDTTTDCGVVPPVFPTECPNNKTSCEADSEENKIKFRNKLIIEPKQRT